MPVADDYHDQVQPAIAYNSYDQEFLIVWEHQYKLTDHDIHGQRVAPDGTRISDRFSIAVSSTYSELHPAVAYNPVNHEYLVIWEKSQSGGVSAQRIGNDGTLIGTAIEVTIGEAHYPAVACNPANGEYLTVWSDDYDPDVDAIFGRRIASNGSLLGSQIEIETESFVSEPDVAFNSTGGQYLVVWSGLGWTGESVDSNIYGRRMGSDGSVLGPRLAISTWQYDQLKPQLAYNSAWNEFLVVWEDHHWSWGNDWDIYGQRVARDGVLLGANFGISWEDSNHRLNPDVAYQASANEYLVTLEYEFTASDHDILSQYILPDGAIPESAIVVSNGSSQEAQPVVGASNTGHYLVVWEDSRNVADQGVDLYAGLIKSRMFAGHVYEGIVGDEGAPLAGVAIELYCSNNASDLGILRDQSTTDTTGRYELIVYNVCEFYNIVETDPAGYISVGSTTEDGTIISSNQIRYEYPLTNKTFSGNNFWDQPKGPIDRTPPGNWTNFIPASWVTSQTVNISVQVEDTFSGLVVSSAKYAYSTDGGISWSAWRAASCTGTEATTSPQIVTAFGVPFGQDSAPNGANRIKFRIGDVAGNPGESPVFSVAIDSVPPANSANLSSPSHFIEQWSNAKNIEVTWTAVSDPTGSGLDGYWFSWSQSTEDDPTYGKTTATTETSGVLASGNHWYFNLRTQDRAGNYAVDTLHLGPFYIDTEAPSNCRITSPASTNALSFKVEWSYQDAHSGVFRYHVQWRDGKSSQWQIWRYTAEGSNTFPYAQNLHTYYFRVKAYDNANNESGYDCQTQTLVHLPTCTDGVKNRDEVGVDCGGSFCPSCSRCATNAKYAPADTVCTQKWPTDQGYELELVTNNHVCNVIEVCDPSLDYIVQDALTCCEFDDFATRLAEPHRNAKIGACTAAHQLSYPQGFNASYNATTLKRCFGALCNSWAGSKRSLYAGLFPWRIIML